MVNTVTKLYVSMYAHMWKSKKEIKEKLEKYMVGGENAPEALETQRIELWVASCVLKF